MPRYIALSDVEKRLKGKVRFGDGSGEEDLMDRDLALRLIDEAEAQVEYDLSPRYSSPFAHETGTAFSTLPAAPTRLYIKTLCEMMSVVRILETDFGSSSGVDAEKYSAAQAKRYDKMVERMLEKREETLPSMQWKYPPLPGLALAPHNAIGDDGFMGSVLVTGRGDGDYPAKQITDPADTFFGGKLDP